jgi:hypothetical protein
MSNLLVTFIYPNAVRFLDDFIKSINLQTTKNFNVLIFNDGVLDGDFFFKKLNIDYQFIDVKGTPAEIRYEAFRFLKSSSAVKIIFQDSDDIMSANRMETCINYLDVNFLVCNDLDLIDNEGNLISVNVWSSRLKNNFLFNYNWIKKFNIVGLGNTAIRKELLNQDMQYSRREPLATDWFLFYQLLEKSKKQGIFVNSCKTLYRQHIDNIAGLGAINEKRLNQAVRVKKSHYEALIDIGYDFKKELVEVEKIEEKQEKSIKINVKQPLFWWEETEIIYEKI